MAPSSTSPSDRVYSMEQLLQFDSRAPPSSAASTTTTTSTNSNTSYSPLSLSSHSSRPTSGISAVTLDTLRSLFPDIVPEEATTTTGADQSSSSSSSDIEDDSEYGEDEYDEDDGFVYGDVITRDDLPEELGEQLRRAVLDALSPPRANLTSPPSSPRRAVNYNSKPLSRTKLSDGPWRASTTMGTSTRTSYSYHDRSTFGVNLFKQASALQSPPRSKMGVDSDNWRRSPTKVDAPSWRNTNVKWNEETSSYVPIVV